MAGVLLLTCGLLATVLGWRVVWRVRAAARRLAGHYRGPQVPEWARRSVPWRFIPWVGEAVIVWKRRARLAKLAAVPLLLVGPLMTALGAVLLVNDVNGHHFSHGAPLAVGACAVAAVLVWRFWRRGRRKAVPGGYAGQDRVH